MIIVDTTEKLKLGQLNFQRNMPGGRIIITGTADTTNYVIKQMIIHGKLVDVKVYDKINDKDSKGKDKPKEVNVFPTANKR